MDDHDVVRRLERYFDDAPTEVVAAYLFGSVARGDSKAGSDVDVAVLFDPVPPSRLGSLPHRIEDDLERTLGTPVDVVVANTAPADLIHRVLRDGHIVLDRDRSARLRFEVDRRNEYFDLQPILKRYRTRTTAA